MMNGLMTSVCVCTSLYIIVRPVHPLSCRPGGAVIRKTIFSRVLFESLVLWLGHSMRSGKHGGYFEIRGYLLEDMLRQVLPRPEED